MCKPKKPKAKAVEQAPKPNTEKTDNRRQEILQALRMGRRPGIIGEQQIGLPVRNFGVQF